MKRRYMATLGAIALLGLLASGVGSLHRQVAGAPVGAVGGPGELRWYKGNLHTHSLWSDGDDFPERIAVWYRDRGYNFLAISDHNTLQQGERWKRYSDLKKKGAGVVVPQYLKDFPDLAKTRGDLTSEGYEVRLTPFDEYKPRLDRPGSFLLIPGEELSDKFGGKPIHMGAVNLAGTALAPQSGESLVDVIRNDLRAIEEQARRENRPVLQHLNHPNFGWGVTAEEMAQVVEERFFEVYNGHPSIRHLGDADHPSVERMWDIANTLRLTTLHAPPLMGLGSDDTHNYHVPGMSRSTPGRGWIQVRSRELSADALIAAIRAGDFYASSGVTLKDVQYDPAGGRLSLTIEPAGDAKFTTQFIGTLAPSGTAVPAQSDIGVVLATAEGLTASYQLKGNELYVRALVTSDQPAANPSFKDQRMQAWIQPVGWERRLAK